MRFKQQSNINVEVCSLRKPNLRRFILWSNLLQEIYPQLCGLGIIGCVGVYLGILCLYKHHIGSNSFPITFTIVTE